jgi:glycosyltransferase involved in cell wall biosynthesis
LIGGADELDAVPTSMWEAARAAGVADRVRFPGRVFGTDGVVPAFDVFINASLFEGASNAIIEALAAGVAIIATRVGGNPDVVDAEETGLLVPAKDAAAIEAALLRLYSDRASLLRMQRRAREVALERHSVEGMVSAYAELFRTWAGRRREPTWERALRAALGVADGALTLARGPARAL